MATHRQSIRLRPHRLRYKSVGALSSTPCSFYSEEAGLNRHSFHLSSDLDFRVHSFGVLHILEFLLKKRSVFVRRQSCMVFFDVHLNVHEARVEIRYNVSPASVIAPVLLSTHFWIFSIFKCYKSTRVKLKDHPESLSERGTNPSSQDQQTVHLQLLPRIGIMVSQDTNLSKEHWS